MSLDEAEAEDVDDLEDAGEVEDGLRMVLDVGFGADAGAGMEMAGCWRGRRPEGRVAGALTGRRLRESRAHAAVQGDGATGQEQGSEFQPGGCSCRCGCDCGCGCECVCCGCICVCNCVCGCCCCCDVDVKFANGKLRLRWATKASIMSPSPWASNQLPDALP